MFDPDRKLFCHHLRDTRDGLVREGVSQRYTIMALLGLVALEKAGEQSPFDVEAIFESCARDTAWIEGVGDLGLMIWLTAEHAPEKLDNLFKRVELETVLDRFSDAKKGRTME